ncbi:hypothetical protein C8R43DRAFT_1104520 [Mycena crocata]|nr:hypothetical protein C8R43DRAFT_1104520 [Mycena crocata]
MSTKSTLVTGPSTSLLLYGFFNFYSSCWFPISVHPGKAPFRRPSVTWPSRSYDTHASLDHFETSGFGIIRFKPSAAPLKSGRADMLITPGSFKMHDFSSPFHFFSMISSTYGLCEWKDGWIPAELTADCHSWTGSSVDPFGLKLVASIPDAGPSWIRNVAMKPPQPPQFLQAEDVSRRIIPRHCENSEPHAHYRFRIISSSGAASSTKSSLSESWKKRWINIQIRIVHTLLKAISAILKHSPSYSNHPGSAQLYLQATQRDGGDFVPRLNLLELSLHLQHNCRSNS